jgi:predicted nucleic acid-binding protein
MIAIDANVLVALAAKTHPSHVQAVAAFERELAANEQFALSLSIAAEFLHAVTDPRRLAPVLDMTEAIRWLRDWNTELAPTWMTSRDIPPSNG